MLLVRRKRPPTRHRRRHPARASTVFLAVNRSNRRAGIARCRGSDRPEDESRLSSTKTEQRAAISPRTIVSGVRRWPSATFNPDRRRTPARRPSSRYYTYRRRPGTGGERFLPPFLHDGQRATRFMHFLRGHQPTTNPIGPGSCV